jgi:tetratricopeptide (TPR) repeat protein
MRVAVLVWLSLLWAFVPSANARPQATAEDSAQVEAAVLRKAERLVQQGKSERAVRELSRTLRKTHSDVLLARYAELALPYALPAGEAQEKARLAAASLFLTALAQRPADAPPLPATLALAAAWAEALRGDFAASQALIARYARADDAHTLPCLRAISARALRAEQPAVAREVLTLARSFAPTDPDLESELGLVALAEGDTETALTALAERFARDPGSLLARRDLAYALSAAGRPAEGFALLGIAAASCGRDPTCLLERGRWAFEAGMLMEALAAAHVLLEREPEHLDGLFLAADTLLEQGELDQARLLYQSILRIAPNNLRAKSALLGLEGSVPGAP